MLHCKKIRCNLDKCLLDKYCMDKCRMDNCCWDKNYLAKSLKDLDNLEQQDLINNSLVMPTWTNVT